MNYHTFKLSKDITQFKHFLFDYDGLLVDSERLYFETWCHFLTPEGKEICKVYHEGKHEDEVYEKVKKHLIDPLSMEEISEKRKIMYETFVSEGKLELLPGIKDLLEATKDFGSLSIVSNSVEKIVKIGLVSTKIDKYFGNYFCFSEKYNRKPAPDLYELAASSLIDEKESLLAFEDSISGIKAAQAAQISVFCISTNTKIGEFCKSEKLKYFKSAEELCKNL